MGSSPREGGVRRRSARCAARAAQSPTVEQPAPNLEKPASKPPTTDATAEASRRNAKRKVSEAVKHISHLPEDLLGEALKPLSRQDIEEWEGWAELESEPAFFNAILGDLGVRGVNVHELFAIDADSLQMLPKPVHGLIFLFEYMGNEEQTEDEGDAEDLWFANQNACATVALLNILMNASGVHLGSELEAFKSSTLPLTTPMRGRCIDSNRFIRSVHNSFTSRMDHLSCDLALENEATAAAKTKSSTKRSRKSKKGRKEDEETAFHFIAYLPASGAVWELDGLKQHPRKLGLIEDGDWTYLARPQIQARMMQYEENQISFNLLALCSGQIDGHKRNIAQHMASLRHAHRALSTRGVLRTGETDIADLANELLTTHRLDLGDVDDAKIPEQLKSLLEKTDITEEEAANLVQELVVEVKAAIGEYGAEVLDKMEADQRVKMRRKDYGQALHLWVSKLAEQGVLEEVINGV